MNKLTLLLSMFLLALTALACAPRPQDPAELLPLSRQREIQLVGSWKLVALRDGHAPQPNEAQTLTFQNDGAMKMDLWEHQLTFKYEVAPDPDHLRLTWVASTNTNDQPGGVITRALVINNDDLTLDGDQFKRVTLASNATPVPSATPVVAATTLPQVNSPTPQVNLPTPTAETNFPAGVVDAKLNQDFVLHVGQVGLLADTPEQLGIILYTIKDDSRCPANVTCVWAGEVRVQITFQENGVLHPPVFELTTNPGDPHHSVTVENYRVEIGDVQPPRATPDQIPPAQYAVTFRVTSAAASTPPPQVTPTPPLRGIVPATLDQPVTLKMFETLELPDKAFHATLNGVLEESRCPKSVQCAQAGRAIVSFMVENANKIGFFGLSTMPPDGRTRGYFQGYVVELLNVTPYPETPGVEIPAVQYSATVVVHQMAPPSTAKKNEGFVLHVGETVTLADENAQVKLVSVTKDSRCPYLVSCAVRGNAIVTVELTDANGAVTTFILNDDTSKQNQRLPDTSLYTMELAALNPYPRGDVIPSPEIKPDEYEVTLVVHKFAFPQPIPTNTPVVFKPANCLGITAADAKGILGETMQEEPLTNVLVQAAGDDNSFYKPLGLCGYITPPGITSNARLKNEPYEMAHNSPAALTTDRLSGARILELVRIVNLLHAANPDADNTPVLILQTRIAAGDWDNVLDSFSTLAPDNKNVHMENVDTFGDKGLWIWRHATTKNYAALVIQDKGSFVVMEALMDQKITEPAAKEAMEAAMKKVFP